MGVNNFRCNFACDEDEPFEDWFESRYGEDEEEFADWAAEQFAEYAQDNMDMWEYGNDWSGDYAIVVKSLGGFRKVFNITREFEPTFSAWEHK